MSAAYDEALAAARELSNPEGRRGYKRTSGLAALVAAQIANELQPIVTYCDGHVEVASMDKACLSVAELALLDAGEATKRIETLCRAMLGDLVEADATPAESLTKDEPSVTMADPPLRRSGLEQAAQRMFDNLTPKEREIVERRFGVRR